jgi:hypothetical protein
VPYFQHGDNIYWWDPDARQRRTVGPGDHAAQASPAPPATRPYHGFSERPVEPGPHTVRNTTVRGPSDDA